MGHRVSVSDENVWSQSRTNLWKHTKKGYNIQASVDLAKDSVLTLFSKQLQYLSNRNNNFLPKLTKIMIASEGRKHPSAIWNFRSNRNRKSRINTNSVIAAPPSKNSRLKYLNLALNLETRSLRVTKLWHDYFRGVTSMRSPHLTFRASHVLEAVSVIDCLQSKETSINELGIMSFLKHNLWVFTTSVKSSLKEREWYAQVTWFLWRVWRFIILDLSENICSIHCPAPTSPATHILHRCSLYFAVLSPKPWMASTVASHL